MLWRKILRLKQENETLPPPPTTPFQGLPAWNIFKFVIENIKAGLSYPSKKKEGISCISYFSNIPCADGPILKATETWGAGRKAPEIIKLKNFHINSDLKLL